MNLPNKLTLFRIILVLPFLALCITTIAWNGNLHWGSGSHLKPIFFMIAGVIFAGAMFTDYLDGYLARKNNQITTFGKLFDPLADKFLTTSALIFFAVLGVTPFYLILVFILRDLLVDGSRNLASKHNLNVAASFWGKAKTMLMSLGLVLMFFVIPFIGGVTDLINPSWEIWILNIPLIVAAIFSTISGYQYFVLVIPYINTK